MEWNPLRATIEVVEDALTAARDNILEPLAGSFQLVYSKKYREDLDNVSYK